MHRSLRRDHCGAWLREVLVCMREVRYHKGMLWCLIEGGLNVWRSGIQKGRLLCLIEGGL